MKKYHLQRYSISDKIFLAFVWVILSLFLIIIAYPLLFVLSASFSGSTSVMSLSLIPKRITMIGYRTVFEYKYIWSGYSNSLLYMIVGTICSLFVTLCCAYPLSRPDFKMKGFVMTLCVITMYISGGLIPTYLTVRNLGLIDSMWAVILPGVMSVYNMIVMRTFFQTQIPIELLEASQIDGCGNTRFIISVVLPLSKAIMAVIGLFYAVGYWNTYFGPMIYLNDRDKFPLSIILREILVVSGFNAGDATALDPEEMIRLAERENVMRYSLIVVASLPVLMLYPFIQKYFVKGVMIGSLKG